MQDDRSREGLERGGGLLVGRAGVDDDRLVQLGGQLELASEQVALPVVRLVVVVEVVAGLADG